MLCDGAEIPLSGWAEFAIGGKNEPLLAFGQRPHGKALLGGQRTQKVLVAASVYLIRWKIDLGRLDLRISAVDRNARSGLTGDRNGL